MINFKKPKISVVLNVYKRGSIFAKQLKAIQSQTIKPHEILVWENGEDSVKKSQSENILIARSNKNLGVWARFSLALNSESEFVCIFDDDTIPGKKWLENCYKNFCIQPGIYGTRGLKFKSRNSYFPFEEVGIYKSNSEVTEVDIVGHSWFLKREWLGYFWAEYKNRFANSLAGEDIHLSYVVQKYLNLGTYVPPHPISDLSLWGSIPEISKKLGSDDFAISKNKKSMKTFENALKHYKNLGFKVISQKIKQNRKELPLIYRIISLAPYTSLKILTKIKSAVKF